MGADQTCNASTADLIRCVMDWTRGKGVDKVIECVGGTQDVTMSQASQVVKRGGLIVVVGTYGNNRATLRMAEFKDRELELRGSRTYVDAFPDCIELVASGKLGLDRLITHHFRLEGVEKGLRLMRDKAENVMKVIVHP
jgi:threonine dehydrogenase-like Zn-dependent dehydrogenase